MTTMMAFFYGVVMFGTAVNALAFPGPAETFKPHLPFNAMNPLPTPAPILSEALKRHLGRRQAQETPVLIAPDNTCGYVSEAESASFTCVDTDATCVLVSSTADTPGLVGCCGLDDCGFRTACVDSSQIAASSCGNACQSDTHIVKCSASSAAFCNSISFPGGAIDFFCARIQERTFLEAETTFSGQTSRTYVTVDLGQFASTDTTATGSETTAAGSETTEVFPGFSNIQTTYTTRTPSPTNTPKSDDNGSNVGPIVGGVLGGVAVIALIGLGIWLLLRKKKQAPDAAAAAQPIPAAGPGPQPPMYQNPPPGGYGQPGQQQSIFSDPNNSNAAAYGQYNQYNPHQGYQQGSPPVSYQNTPAVGMGAAGGYYGGKEGSQNLGPEPNRADSTSPVSNFNRFSQQPPVSPNSTTGTPSFLPMHGVPPQGGQTGLVEAGGNPIGQSDHHRGQLHELA